LATATTFTVSIEEDMEAYRLDIVQELFFLITTSTIETEAILATGTIEAIIGTEMIIGIEIEAGIKAVITMEVGTIVTTTAAELRTETTIETT
jgi:hypothetical protein